MRDEQPHGAIVNPETAHEESDVNVRALIWFAIIFVVFAIVTHVVIYFMYKGLEKAETRKAPPPLSAIARAPNAAVPQNQPLLQPFPLQKEKQVSSPTKNTPVTDLVEMRANEDKALKNYGWIDQSRGLVRMPIDVAKQIVVQRGLPVQDRNAMATPPVPAAQTLVVQQPVPGGRQ